MKGGAAGLWGLGAGEWVRMVVGVNVNERGYTAQDKMGDTLGGSNVLNTRSTKEGRGEKIDEVFVFS